MSEIEKWKQVPGWEQTHEVSSFGTIRRLTDSPTGGHKKGFVLKPNVNVKNGYLSITLYKKGRAFPRYIHRLVCEAFNGPPPTPKHHAGHKNGKRDDNRAANLRWITAKENYNDKRVHGTNLWGEKCHFSKLSNREVLIVFELRAAGLTQEKIGNSLGVTQGHISEILRGKKRKEMFIDA